MNGPIFKIDTKRLRTLDEDSDIDRITYAVKKKQAW